MDIKAIRGATTINFDNQQEITQSSCELLNEILNRNQITLENIIYIQISSTIDIKSYYPATALRLNGCTVPLFSCLEPQIENSLNKCIRFLCLVKINSEPNHVYLNNASTLLNPKKMS